MPTKVAQLTDDKMRAIIGEVVEQKLLELSGDSDAGLVITKTLRNRLLRQQKATAKGERGELLESVVARLGLA